MDYKGEKSLWGFLYMHQVIIFRFQRNRAKRQKNFCPLRSRKVVLAWPKILFRFSLKMLQKNPNELLGQPNPSRILSSSNDYSCLENPMDRGAWWAAVHGIAKSRTRLSDFTLTFHFHALEKEMATHSSVLAWRIPGTGGPGGLPCMESHRFRTRLKRLSSSSSSSNN